MPSSICLLSKCAWASEQKASLNGTNQSQKTLKNKVSIKPKDQSELKNVKKQGLKSNNSKKAQKYNINEKLQVSAFLEKLEAEH